MRAAKSNALDPRISDVQIIEDMLNPLVEAGSVVGKNGESLRLDASRVSKLMNHKDDVPGALRRALERFGVAEETLNAFPCFIEDRISPRNVDAFASDVASLIEDDANISQATKGDLLALRHTPISFLSNAFLEAIRCNNKTSIETHVWKHGTGSLTLEVGDLLSHGFGRSGKTKSIVVIPVNTTFDSKISWAYEGGQYPLVSEKTIHGQWLRRMEDSGVSMSKLSNDISVSLKELGAKPISKFGSGTSPNAEYAIGTIAILETSKAVFFLLAFSSFDEFNNAHSTQESVIEALNQLIDFYDKRGQGRDIYLPLIGTGLSRAGLTHQESLDLIKKMVASNESRVHGRFTVVVRDADSNELAI